MSGCTPSAAWPRQTYTEDVASMVEHYRATGDILPTAPDMLGPDVTMDYAVGCRSRIYLYEWRNELT
jgi:hypothetical protein